MGFNLSKKPRFNLTPDTDVRQETFTRDEMNLYACWAIDNGRVDLTTIEMFKIELMAEELLIEHNEKQDDNNLRVA